ncbi:MAG: protein phosphatase 2C domain-containing protein [Proteobacteria bacterium]|nr:protein phosphatase 2C domain-containing protein [Pseudomonadota bacterium]
MKILTAGLTHKGLVRKTNQDCFLVCDQSPSLYIVADGIGGNLAGEVASRMAVDIIKDHISSVRSGDQPYMNGFDRSLSESRNRLTSAIQLANHIIYLASKEKTEWKGMGTTVAAAWLSKRNEPNLTIGHVGDSRIFLIRNNTIRQLTKDHSIRVERRQNDFLQVSTHALGPQIKNYLSRAVGTDKNVCVDTREIKILPQDRFLLASDGLTNMISDEVILKILCSENNPESASQHLIDAAKKNGGRDNITVIVIHSK